MDYNRPAWRPFPDKSLVRLAQGDTRTSVESMNNSATDESLPFRVTAHRLQIEEHRLIASRGAVPGRDVTGAQRRNDIGARLPDNVTMEANCMIGAGAPITCDVEVERAHVGAATECSGVSGTSVRRNLRLNTVRWKKGSADCSAPTRIIPGCIRMPPNPTPECIGGGLVRIYFSTRDNFRRSSIAWVEVDMAEPTRVVRVADTPVLAPRFARQF